MPISLPGAAEVFARVLRGAYGCPMTSKTRTPQRAAPALAELDEPDDAGQGYERSWRRVPDPDGAWMLTMYWQDIDGRRECVGMKLVSIATAEEANGPPGMEMPAVGQVLTPGLVRDLKIGEQIRDVRAHHERLFGGGRPAVRPPGLRQSTFERLQLVAKIYREAFAADGKPTTAVAEHFGLTVGGASSLVSRARDIGLIPPTSRGASQG